MKITFKASGGFVFLPGLSQPFAIDTEELAPQAAHELEALVLESQFFAQPARAEGPVGAADYRTYTITVEDGPRIHTIEFTDLIDNASLQQLAARLHHLARSSNR